MWDKLDIYCQDRQFDYEALRRQDPLEFERLYLAYAPVLQLYLVRLCGDSETASDILQETFVKAYNALPRIDLAFRLRPWLYKIATNTAYSAARMNRWKSAWPFGQYPPEQASPFSFENHYAEAEMVEHALAAIKPEYAAVLLMHWREGFSLDELCQILGINMPNLKKRLYRAKRAFSSAYSRECATQEEGRA